MAPPTSRSAVLAAAALLLLLAADAAHAEVACPTGGTNPEQLPQPCPVEGGSLDPLTVPKYREPLYIPGQMKKVGNSRGWTEYYR